MIKGFKARVPRKYIGTYRPKIDGWEKASGRTEYVDDLTLQRRFPGMLYAKALRSPYPHAHIKSMDITKCERIHGVKAVLKYDDPEIASLKPTNSGWTDAAETVTYERMYFPQLRDRRVLSNHVCWVGDEAGVVVAAESETIADQALRSIQVEWKILPFVLDPLEAMKPGAPIIHPEIAPDTNVLPPRPQRGSHVVFEKGDVAKAFAEADVVVEAESRYHNPTHGVLDGWCCVAVWEGDKLTIWSNSYAAHQTRMHVSEMLEIPLNKVRVVCPYIGAQMGKGDTGDHVFFLYTALLAKKSGRPVKFKHMRRESFSSGRTPEIGHCRIGAKKDGRILGLHLKTIGDAGAYADHTLGALEVVPAEYAELSLAHIASAKLVAEGVYTNTVPASCQRSIGHIQTNFMIGHALELLSEKLDMDPVEVVIKNFGDEYDDLPNKSLEAVLREGAKRIGWEKRCRSGLGPVQDGSKKRGMGFSFNVLWHAAWQERRRGPIEAIVRVNPDGSVHLEAPMVEIGGGSNSCSVFACAEALGVAVEDIRWVSTVDTEAGIRDQTQTDSCMSHTYSEIIHIAASEAKKKLLALAAQKLRTGSDALDMEEGRIFVKSDREKGLTIKELLWKGDLTPVIGHIAQQTSGDKPGISFMATFADVGVDTATGEVEVVKLVVASDAGTVMYASGAEGQLIGGQCMGLGESLSEEIVYDETTGVPLNLNWIDYKIPTMADFPEIDPVPMEVWKGGGEFGACGIGEAALVCTPRAIANAVYNAIGIGVNDLPITPDKVLKALGGREVAKS
jgi:CO/xanthine dehydrogenase Mo-binding subunit